MRCSRNRSAALGEFISTTATVSYCRRRDKGNSGLQYAALAAWVMPRSGVCSSWLSDADHSAMAGKDVTVARFCAIMCCAAAVLSASRNNDSAGAVRVEQNHG